MTIILDNYTLPEKGKLELNIQASVEIVITAKEAHYKGALVVARQH